MTIKFNKPFFTLSMLLFSSEVCIATFLTEGFIRHTFGDFLVVILMYCTIRSFMKTKSIHLASTVLIIAFGIEFLQLYNLLEFLNLSDNALATIILGSTFETSDLVAYTFGIISIYLIDKNLTNKK